MLKVSICIPTYNMANYVGLAIDSALAQSFADIEIIVCDNASTDNTREVLSKFNDSRIKIFYNETNLGAIRNFNKTVECSSGEYIKFLEADDLLFPECVEKMLPMLEENPDIVMVNCEKDLIDSNGKILEHRSERVEKICNGNEIINSLRQAGNVFGTPSDLMLRKSALDKTGLFDIEYGNYLNDWDLWIRLAETGSVGFVAGVLAQVRRHAGQIGAVGALTNRDLHVALLMIQKRFSKGYSNKYKTRFLFHVAEEFIWRAIFLFFKNSSAKTFKNIIDVSIIPIKYIGLSYPLFILFFILHSPIFFFLLADRKQKRLKDIKQGVSELERINH